MKMLKNCPRLWVVVRYDDEFPGKITNTDGDNIEVNDVMTRSARAWKWPVPEDRLFYNKEDILHIINPPAVAAI